MTAGASYQVDVIAGDGIGQEVMPAAIACVDAVAARPGLRDHLARAGLGIGPLPGATAG